MLNFGGSVDNQRAMSLIEPRLSDLRAGFSGFSFSGGAGLPTSPAPLPLWCPPTGPPVSWCTIPNCPCAMSVSRSQILLEMYEYSSLSRYWSAWYFKAAQDPLYKGLALPPPLPPSLDGPALRPATPEHVDVDSRSSPGKELPSKISKHERVKNWLELSKPPKYEKEHQTVHRQNSTELRLPLRSSPTPEHYRNGEPVSMSETYSLHSSYMSSHPGLRSPPPHPPPCYPHARADLHSPHEGPLNLTVNNNIGIAGARSGSHSPAQSRPSVITCNTLPEREHRYETSSGGSASPSRRDSSADICDPAIEEHFRRSLGRNYPEYLTKNNSLTPSPLSHLPLLPLPLNRQLTPPCPSSPGTRLTSQQSSNKNVSITGSVDDHFARALGDSTWSALKAKNDETEAPAVNSVDDHFAKALGDTWLRLKDKKDQPRVPGSHPFPLSHPIPHPLPHPIPRAHSLPHPVPQPSTSPSSKSHSGPLLST